MRFIISSIAVAVILLPQPVLGIISTFLAILSVEGWFQLNPFETFRRLRCTISFAALNIDITVLDRASEYFREDSKMILAQAGIYEGIDNIKEYIGFAIAGPSSYFTTGPEQQGQALRIAGFDENGRCDFTASTHNRYTLNPETTDGSDPLEFPVMARFLFDEKEKYLVQTNIFYNTGFLEHFFGTILSSSKTKDFICRQVLTNKCAGANIIPAPTQCVARLDNLPAAEGSQQYIDGNSLGCRALHATFANTNPVNHCAHVALDRTADPNGRFKCQDSLNIPIDSLFSPADLDFHARYAAKFGFDSKGFRVLSE
jgi:hypothetical protein